MPSWTRLSRALVGWLLVASVLAVPTSPAGATAPTEQAVATAGATFVNSRFGYRVMVPAGWYVSRQTGDGQPAARSTDVYVGLSHPSVYQEYEGMQLAVCLGGGGVCPSYPFRILKATKTPATLGGVSAIRFNYTRATATETRVWREVHFVVVRGRYTYDVFIDLPMGQRTLPSAFAALLRSWRWLPLPPTPVGFPGVHLHMVSGSAGWALGSTASSLVLHTTTGGASWDQAAPSDLPPGTAVALCQASFLTAESAWLACPTPHPAPSAWTVIVWRTADGGRRWQRSSATTIYPPQYIAGFLNVTSLDFVNSHDGWMSVQPASTMNSSPGELLRTTDGGATWTEVSQSEGAHPPRMPVGGAAAFVNSRQGWLVGARVSTAPKALFRTTDGGRTWTSVSLPTVPVVRTTGTVEGTASPDAPPAFFGNRRRESILSATIWTTAFGLTGDEPLVTRDGGRTWAPLPSLPGGGWLVADFISANLGWVWVPNVWDPPTPNYVTLRPLGGVVFRTTDGGKTWVNMHGLLDLRQLDFVSPTTGFALTRSPGTGTGAVWRTTDAGATWTRAANS